MQQEIDIVKFCDYLEKIGFLITSFPKQDFIKWGNTASQLVYFISYYLSILKPNQYFELAHNIVTHWQNRDLFQNDLQVQQNINKIANSQSQQQEQHLTQSEFNKYIKQTKFICEQKLSSVAISKNSSRVTSPRTGGQIHTNQVIGSKIQQSPRNFTPNQQQYLSSQHQRSPQQHSSQFQHQQQQWQQQQQQQQQQEQSCKLNQLQQQQFQQSPTQSNSPSFNSSQYKFNQSLEGGNMLEQLRQSSQDLTNVISKQYPQIVIENAQIPENCQKEQIFDRLYRDAATRQEKLLLAEEEERNKLKQMQKQQQSQIDSPRGQDISERLYKKYFDQQLNLMQKSIERNQEQQLECTFKPQICSKELGGINETQNIKTPVFDRLYQKALDSQRIRQSQEELSKLNPQLFINSPHINKKSQDIIREEPIHEHLYKFSLQKEQKEKKLKDKIYKENGYTFTPKTNHKKSKGKDIASPLKFQSKLRAQLKVTKSQSDIHDVWNNYQKEFKPISNNDVSSNQNHMFTDSKNQSLSTNKQYVLNSTRSYLKQQAEISENLIHQFQSLQQE